MVTTQSVPDLVAASRTNSLYTLLCISTAETGSAGLPDADQSVMNVDVPVVTTETFGLTLARFGRIEPGGFHSGVAENASSATASSE